MPTRHNHGKNILSRAHSPIKAIEPGMFIEFLYDIPKTSDPKPFVFVLWNDDLYRSGSKHYLIHGINLNYLNEHLIKKVFSEVMEGSNRANEELNIPYTEEPMTMNPDLGDSNRNLIKKPITKIDLPYAGNIKGGRKLNMSESQRQMELLYEKKIKPFVKSMNMYRTYKIDKMKTIKSVKYGIRGILLND